MLQWLPERNSSICGIKKHLTTHMARHTFATTITLEHDAPIETVSQMLGHKSIRTTQIDANVSQRKVSQNMKALKEKLQQKPSKLKHNKLSPLVTNGLYN